MALSKPKAPGIVEMCEITKQIGPCINFMRTIGMILTQVSCEICENDMTLMEKKARTTKDLEIWHCKTCKRDLSIKHNTIFKDSKLPTTDCMLLYYAFAQDLQIYMVERLFPNFNHKTIVSWYEKFRNQMQKALYKEVGKMSSNIDVDINESTIEEFEIDESKMGKKRKYGKGKFYQQFWVFGMKERSSRKTIFRVVSDRKKETLVPIIKEYAKPGSNIISDDWRAYRCLSDEGYSHSVVVHSKEFVTSEGVHTNGIEGLWGMIKQRIIRQKGLSKDNLQQILDEFSYRYLNNHDIFFDFTKYIHTY